MKTLLKNGKIYDGTGAEPFVGDVLVEDERIAAAATWGVKWKCLAINDLCDSTSADYRG